MRASRYKTAASGLPPRQQRAIAALLDPANPTLVAAAKAAGMAESTLHAWLVDPAFVEAYRRARRSVSDAGLAGVIGLIPEAVEALRRNLTCAHPPTEIRAAVAVLAHALGAQALADLQAEIDDLRARLGRPDEPEPAAGTGRGPRKGGSAAPTSPGADAPPEEPPATTDAPPPG